MKAKKIVKIIAITLACVIGAAALIIGGYVGYVAVQYYRIEDNFELQTENGRDKKAGLNRSYTVMTYNTGFGAYSPDYSFFMDTGVMDDGTEVVGKYAKGRDKADVKKNVDGQTDIIKNADADFYFLQEVDEKADRSYGINMKSVFSAAFENRSATYAENFHTANLFYPFNDPIGITDAGILTLSSYNIQSAVRRSFPLTDNFIDKLFDLDRCFAVHYLPLEGSDKFLVLINLHMSAYDKGGAVRAQQLEMLNGVLKEERAKGNYVVAGGDFNHCLIADYFESDEQALSHFESRQQVPEWVKNSVLHNSELAEGFRIASDKDVATCRGADIPYEKGVNYTNTIDGFIVSDNVEVVAVNTLNTEYAFSDHNPVVLKFALL